MVGNKLSKLKKEIQKYVGIPYWINKLDGKKIVIEGVGGGKNDYFQIQKATQKIAKSLGLSLKDLSKLDIYRLQKKHHIGIDCSGLAYHLLDFWYKLNTGKSIKKHIIGTDNLTGPRRVNVKMLSNPKNSIKLKNISNLKTGDLIITRKRGHVLFVIDANDRHINYVHSSPKTQTKGVHLGKITITDPKKILKNLNQDIYPKLGDGIYRLIILKDL